METRYFLNASNVENQLLECVDVDVGASHAESDENGTRKAAELDAADDLYYVPGYLVVLLSTLYGAIAVVAVVGNAVVLAAIAHSGGMRTVTNFFIANLSAADALIGLFSIPFQFQAALLQRWDLPRLLCKAAPFVKEVSVSVSVLALVVVSVDRYVAVLHPLRRRLSAHTAAVVMLAVWLVGIASGLPSAVV